MSVYTHIVHTGRSDKYPQKILITIQKMATFRVKREKRMFW